MYRLSIRYCNSVYIKYNYKHNWHIKDHNIQTTNIKERTIINNTNNEVTYVRV